MTVRVSAEACNVSRAGEQGARVAAGGDALLRWSVHPGATLWVFLDSHTRTKEPRSQIITSPCEADKEDTKPDHRLQLCRQDAVHSHLSASVVESEEQ